MFAASTTEKVTKELMKKLLDKEYMTLFEAGPLSFMLTKHTVVMFFMFGLMILLVGYAGYRYRTQGSDIPRGYIMNAVEAFVLYVRDNMVYPVMGEKHGRTYLPFFLTLFLFLLFGNILGKIPPVYIPGTHYNLYPGGAPTADPFITSGLAVLVFFVGIGGGIKENGLIGYFKNFVPHGVPWPLAILLWPIEVFGTLIKHAVLAIRLLGNLNAGNAALYGLLAAGVIMIDLLGVWGWIAGIVGQLPLSVFLTFIKLLVLVIHAYIFTILSVLFMDMQVSGH